MGPGPPQNARSSPAPRAALRVFLSHTSELTDYPKSGSYVQAAVRAINEADCVPVEMSHFPAVPMDPAAFCELLTQRCDVFIAVIGHRYGSIADTDIETDTDLSYMDVELRAAEQAGIERLVFLLDEQTPFPPHLIDVDRARILDLRQRAATVVRKVVTNPDSLNSEIYKSLVRYTSARSSVYARTASVSVGPEPEAVTTQLPPLSPSPLTSPSLSLGGRTGERRRRASARRRLFVGNVPPYSRSYQKRVLTREIIEALPRGPVILHGGGGTGKTQLAAHFAESQRRQMSIVWVDASSPSSFISGLAGAYRMVQEAGWAFQGHDPDPQQQVDRFLEFIWADAERTWLLVLDNLDDATLLAKVAAVGGVSDRPGSTDLEPIRAGQAVRVLVTTRDQHGDMISSGTQIGVDSFTDGEAAEYLARRLKTSLGSRWDKAGADRLAERLDRLPLALALACGFILDRDISCDKYVELFARGEMGIFEGTADGYPAQRAWAVAVNHLLETNLVALRALLVASVLHSTAPAALWRTEKVRAFLARPLPPAAAPAIPDPVSDDDADSALHALRVMSLIELPQPKRTTVRTHALVQSATWEHVLSGEGALAAEVAARGLIELWNDDDIAPLLQVNAEALYARAPEVLWTDSCRELLFLLGRRLGDSGYPERAQQHFSDMYRTAAGQGGIGVNDPDTLRMSYNLAYWRGRSGDHDGAVRALVRLLNRQEKAVPADPVGVIRTRHWLAVFQGRRDPRRAAVQLREIGRKREALAEIPLGERLQMRGHYAYFLGYSGKTRQAAALYWQLIREAEEAQRALARTHKGVDPTLEELVFDLRANEAQWLAEARGPDVGVALYAPLVEDLKHHARFGLDHPRTLQALHGLAWWKAECAQERDDAALKTEALADFVALGTAKQKKLNEKQRSVTADLNKETANYDVLLAERDRWWWQARFDTSVGHGRAVDALLELRRVITAMTAKLGTAHVEVLIARRRAALLTRDLGQPQAALAELEVVWRDAIAVLAPDHPDVEWPRTDAIQLDAQIKRAGGERGHLFRVWAPDAVRVEASVNTGDGERTFRALPVHQGWWAVWVDGAGHGTDYWFTVTPAHPPPRPNRPERVTAAATAAPVPRPDPRSGWQPEGVHGPSRVFDSSKHVWASTQWSYPEILGGVFYELHVGTFTPEGTFDAAIKKLPHLVELGVDVVQVMPVAAFEGRWGWGYDGVDLYAVHESYGGQAAFQRFVDACHLHGLAVCLDAVYNHVGSVGNYLDAFGPYLNPHQRTIWGPALNLDSAGSDGVRRWICDNALRWFEEFRVDGLRIDAVQAFGDTSDLHILAQLSREVAALAEEQARRMTLIADSNLSDPKILEPVAESTIDGDVEQQPSGADAVNLYERLPALGLDGQWIPDLHHTLHTLLRPEPDLPFADDFGTTDDFGTAEALQTVLTKVFHRDAAFSLLNDITPDDGPAVGRRWPR